MDGWRSALTGLGYTGRDKRMAADFHVEEIGFETAAALWRGDDIAARVIEKPPAEELRQGFDLQINGTDYPRELAELITGRWEDLGLGPALEEARCFERAYGGGAILLGVDDGGRLDEPLQLDKVRAFEWLTTLEARELVPTLYYTNPAAPKFGRPAVYTLHAHAQGTPVEARTEAPRNVRVHESRLIVFPGIRVSRRQLAVGTHGWGDSVLTRLWRVLGDYGMTWASVAVLVSEFAQPIFKVKGLAELIAGDKDSIVQGRMQALAFSRSVVNTLLIDGDEEFKREQTPLSGIPELLDKFTVRLAAAADMPVTLLMGQSPAGLNATGESDIRFFYDRVRASQERKLRPAIEYVAKILFRLFGRKVEPESWSIQFRPLWQPSEKEQAEARLVQAQVDQIYLQNGVLETDEVARSRFKGDEFSFATVVDFDERAAREPDPADDVPPDPPAGAVPPGGNGGAFGGSGFGGARGGRPIQ